MTMQDVCTDSEMVHLLERAKRHDSAALDRLYQLYIDKVYRYIWYRVGDQATAEDLAADVFVRMVEHVDGFRIPPQQQVAAFSAWLFRIASNLINDHHRRRARTDRYVDSQKDELSWSGAGTFDGELHQIASQDHLRAALAQLNDSQRDVLYYRFVADLSSAQTASAMKKSESAIKALQHRALESLRRALGAEG